MGKRLPEFLAKLDTQLGTEDYVRKLWSMGIQASVVDVHVDHGVVTFGGTLRDAALVPVLTRAARAVEGVVDIRLDLAPPTGES